MDGYRILMVDDDEDLCEIVRYNLQTGGYRVDVTYSAEEALLKTISNYDLLILDCVLVKMSGFKLAHIIRNDPKTSTLPIVFISAKNSENDRLTGFSLGADDYITKPFSIRELVARINTIIKRYEAKKTPFTQLITYDRLKLNLINKTVAINGEEIQFTKKEFELLTLFLENKNRIFSRNELLALVWSEDAYVLSRTIDVNITRIRTKIGRYGTNLVTKLGLGYCFEE